MKPQERAKDTVSFLGESVKGSYKQVEKREKPTTKIQEALRTFEKWRRESGGLGSEHLCGIDLRKKGCREPLRK